MNICSACTRMGWLANTMVLFETFPMDCMMCHLIPVCWSMANWASKQAMWGCNSVMLASTEDWPNNGDFRQNLDLQG